MNMSKTQNKKATENKTKDEASTGTWVVNFISPTTADAQSERQPCRDAADKERYTLKAGDVVTLKSGGPLMTVYGHREARDADGKLLPYEVVACVWFGGETFDHPNHRDFRADTLSVR